MKQNHDTSRLFGTVIIMSVIASCITAAVITSVINSKPNTLPLNSQTKGNKYIVHISSSMDNPHSQMMGLQKALKLREAGVDVFVYMDVNATSLALNQFNVQFADFSPSQEIIKSIIAKGGKVYVCPHCLMVNGGKMSDVQAGIGELSMDAMINFTKDSNVTSLDY